MKFNTLEKILNSQDAVIFAVGAVVVISFIFGASSFVREYSLYSKERRNFKQKYTRTISLGNIQEEQETLRQQSREGEEKIKYLQDEVKQSEAQFAPLSPETYEQTKLLVFDLAVRYGLRITDENITNSKAESSRRRNPNMDFSREVRSAPIRKTFFEQYPEGGLYKRPVLKFKATATFAGAKMFLTKLEHLRWSVTPIQFSLVHKEQKDRAELSNVQQYSDFMRREIPKEMNVLQENSGDLELTVVLAL